MVQAIILCAGKGVRLGELTSEIPKPMLKFNDKPFLEYIIEGYNKQKINDIIIPVGYLKNKITSYFEDGSKFGVDIFYAQSSVEVENGGSFKKALPFIKEDYFFVQFGDVLFPLDYGKLLKTLIDSGKKALVVASFRERKLEEFEDKNDLIVDKKGIVVGYDRGNTTGKANMLHGGILLLKKEIIEYDFPDVFKLEEVLFSNLIPKRELIAFVTGKIPYDIGNVNKIERFKEYAYKLSSGEFNEWKDYNLEGKTILLNGASTGIGKKIANFLISKGCNLIITSANKGRISVTFSELRDKKGKGMLKNFVCDITKNSCTDSLIRFLKKDKIVLDALINCAGVLGPLGLFGETEFDKWKKTIDINLTGNAFIIHKMIPFLLKSKSPKIINFGGGGAAYSRPFHTAYASSKTGMVRLTEILAEEYKKKIDVNIVAPGAHKTRMWKNETYDKEPEKWANDNRLFGLIAFLISDLSKGVTGRFIHIENDWENLTFEISNTERFVLRRTN